MDISIELREKNLNIIYGWGTAIFGNSNSIGKQINNQLIIGEKHDSITKTMKKN